MKPVIRTSARRDILNQFVYFLDQGALPAAEKFLEAVKETVSKILERPSMGAPKRLKNFRFKGLRKWSVSGFDVIQIYYLVAHDEIQILRVLHGKRDVDRLLGRE